MTSNAPPAPSRSFAQRVADVETFLNAAKALRYPGDTYEMAELLIACVREQHAALAANSEWFPHPADSEITRCAINACRENARAVLAKYALEVK